MTTDERFTLAALRSWAGETIFKRGLSYQRSGRVRDLALTADGALLAWVQGSGRYATQLTPQDGRLTSNCTCPYGLTCKHAVALGLEYLSRPAHGSVLPLAAARDPRLLLLSHGAASAPQATPTLQAYLATLSNPELTSLLLDFAARFPEVRSALETRQMLAGDDSDELEIEVLRRIVSVSVEGSGDWDDDWQRPDFGSVLDGLNLLLERGHADAVVRLGSELLDNGLALVEQVQFDELASELSACFTLVFQALLRSSLPPQEQILWAIDAALRDDYGFCDRAVIVLDHAHPPAAWSAVADELLARLAALPVKDDANVKTVSFGRLRRFGAGQPPVGLSVFRRSTARAAIASYAARALQAAGRADQLIALWEREAQANDSYQELVKTLIDAGHSADAEHWARLGIAATSASAPGIANGLKETLVTLRTDAGDPAQVAALRADTFFASPSRSSFQALMDAATLAGVGAAVRAAALDFLETGQLPTNQPRQAAGGSIPAWPLPASGIALTGRSYPLAFPQIALLIELAISERRVDDVLHWYDRRGEVQYVQISHDTVADAIVAQHPERAAAIWLTLTEAAVAQTNAQGYAAAATYLRKLRRVWAQLGQTGVWQRYIDTLRTANRRKRNFMDTLDGLVREAK